jgi:homoserine kinase
MALSLHAEVGIGSPPSGATPADRHHPATVAFRRLGGEGRVWVRSPIPVGRGLGFSGAIRVGGAAAAIVQRMGSAGLESAETCEQILDVAGELEGHADNAAASLHGGIVVVADGRATSVPLAFDPAVVVWIPTDTTTSTDRSRASLPSMVAREDAVFNLGRVGMFVAACARGDAGALRIATEDRLHQATRLAVVPETARALRAGLEADVWAAWLSGSGPTVAMLCESSRADDVAAALPATGHTKSLRIDHEGAVAIGLGPDGATDDDNNNDDGGGGDDTGAATTPID